MVRYTRNVVDGQPVPAAARQKMVTVLIGPGETRDIDFLGPPLAHGGTLYVLARTEDAAHLLAPMRCDARTVHVRGIEREVAVHALRAQH